MYVAYDFIYNESESSLCACLCSWIHTFWQEVILVSKGTKSGRVCFFEWQVVHGASWHGLKSQFPVCYRSILDWIEVRCSQVSNFSLRAAPQKPVGGQSYGADSECVCGSD